jgi:hypothetical protein
MVCQSQPRIIGLEINIPTLILCFAGNLGEELDEVRKILAQELGTIYEGLAGPV